MELTRRNFIVGAGVAAGASALAGLAGCSSQGSASSSASATETKEASKAAERRALELGRKPDLPSDDEIVETYDCDICVCGLGVAGPLAMYYAMQKATTLSHCRNSNACTMAAAVAACSTPKTPKSGGSKAATITRR